MYWINNNHDYYGDDYEFNERREIEELSSEQARNYHEWLSHQDSQTIAEERLFRSDGL